MSKLLRFACLLAGLATSLPILALPPGAAAHPSGFAWPPGADAELQLPLGTAWTDDTGRVVRLADYFPGDRPAVLVLGDFECPNLCSTVMDGVLESLVQAQLPADGYRLLAVSLDPRETNAAAQRRLGAYRPLLDRRIEAHFLVGTPASATALADALGYPFAWDAEHRQYVHPAGLLVVTPAGRIARWFGGVRFESRELRLALVDAGDGRAGTISDRVILWCSHFDPQTGRHTFAAETAVRAAGMLGLIGLLAGFVRWRRRQR